MAGNTTLKKIISRAKKLRKSDSTYAKGKKNSWTRAIKKASKDVMKEKRSRK